MPVTDAQPTAAPTDEAIDWRHRPDDAEAHAFGDGRGWMRAKCRRIPLTIALLDAPEDMPRCRDCADAAGLPELVERSRWGDR